VCKTVDARLGRLASRLFNDIKTSTIDEKELEVIDQTRLILDASMLKVDLQKTNLSPLAYSLATFPAYLEAITKLYIDFSAIPESVVEKHYQTFIKLVEAEKNLDAPNLMLFWSKLFDENEKLFEGIETVLHTAAVAAVKSSCESVVESFVSKYEYHSNSRRNLDDDSISDECMIAQNGPALSKCEKSLRGHSQSCTIVK